MLAGEKLALPEQKLEMGEPSENRYRAAPPNTIATTACELDVVPEDDNFLTALLGRICIPETAEQPKHVTSFS